MSKFSWKEFFGFQSKTELLLWLITLVLWTLFLGYSKLFSLLYPELITTTWLEWVLISIINISVWLGLITVKKYSTETT